MSLPGIKTAKEYGKRLPGFEDIAQARRFFYQLRDDRLAKLTEIAKSGKINFHCDLSPESLREIETEYFRLCENDSFSSFSIGRATFEECMGIYLLAVAVKNSPPTEWIVSEFAFEKGKFELGVKKGLLCMIAPRFTDYYRTPNNKRRDSLFRKYKRYFA